jgi:hypothetical protein
VCFQASELDEPFEDAISCRVAVQSWAGQKNGFRKANQDAYVLAKAEDRRLVWQTSRVEIVVAKRTNAPQGGTS